MKLQISNVSAEAVKIQFRRDGDFESIELAANDSTTVESDSIVNVIPVSGEGVEDVFDRLKELFPGD